MKKCLFLVLLSLMFNFGAQSKEIELSGLVLDRTITRFGKDFTFYFSSYWREVPQTDGVSVVIYERVYPQAGTYLWLELNQKKIYETYFGRRYNDVKKKAEQATIISVNALAALKAQSITEATRNKDN
ncbi:curli production assembly/transport protein CsgE [Shewanella avicenniae]|uniref:Curli production assembly/transport component CsgE n=1 Tax=Shewanella avicenniae TaxID=2814294 RepID=A0ABX7QQY8_9GAMM|nr:curli production assembly/transport protein CsgE [Shewanella avicenniae]